MGVTAYQGYSSSGRQRSSRVRLGGLPVTECSRELAGISAARVTSTWWQLKVYRALDELLPTPRWTWWICACRRRCIGAGHGGAKAGKQCFAESAGPQSVQARKIVQAARTASGLFHAGNVHAVSGPDGLPEAGGEGRTVWQVQGGAIPPHVANARLEQGTYASGIRPAALYSTASP